jgi:hypothetical protein
MSASGHTVEATEQMVRSDDSLRPVPEGTRPGTRSPWARGTRRSPRCLPTTTHGLLNRGSCLPQAPRNATLLRAKPTAPATRRSRGHVPPGEAHPGESRARNDVQGDREPGARRIVGDRRRNRGARTGPGHAARVHYHPYGVTRRYHDCSREQPGSRAPQSSLRPGCT